MYACSAYYSTLVWSFPNHL